MKNFLSFLLIALILPSLALSESLLDTIKDRGKIKIGSTLQYPPQMYRDSNGKPSWI